MTNTNLFDTLEICLQALEQGADVESCLARFPAQADDLRPILTAAIRARSISVTEVPVDAVLRGRARVLQAAAEMRTQRSAAPVSQNSPNSGLGSFWRLRQNGFFGVRFFRLALTTAIMLAFLLTGGTGLVNASSNTIPGDQLYPVKRSWEDVQLFFVFDSHARTELEHKFDHERVLEIEELYSEERIAQVNFQGVVQTRNNNTWVIDGLEIEIEKETKLSANILPGSRVQVIGKTDDGIIEAEQIILISTPGATPVVQPNSTQETTPQVDASEIPETTEAPSDDDNESEETGKNNPGISKSTEQPSDELESKPPESNLSTDHSEEQNQTTTDKPEETYSDDKKPDETQSGEHKSDETQSSEDKPKESDPTHD